jgi:hypothetical protein
MPPGYEVHHRIPQKYREMFPDGRVDMISNWAGVEKDVHSNITSIWAEWSRAHPNPLPAAVEEFAAKIDLQFGARYLLP